MNIKHNGFKIHILHKFHDTPWGGGNQFLKALRNYFQKIDIYSEDIKNADILLFNSFPFGNLDFFDLAFKYKKLDHKILIHRVDGPISIVRNSSTFEDRSIFLFNAFLADATIYQSEWSKNQNKRLFHVRNTYETIITNASDPDIFFPLKNHKKISSQKIKLIATSWSANFKKGFNYYKFLDDNLDWEKYSMTFVGNSPITFKNITKINALPSTELAHILRKHDVYITASQDDPCSNSLIEALHCGLPAIALKSGGHPEIIKNNGICFSNNKELLDALANISNQLLSFKSNIKIDDINSIGNRYYLFFKKIYSDTISKKYNPKKASDLQCFYMRSWLKIGKYIT